MSINFILKSDVNEVHAGQRAVLQHADFRDAGQRGGPYLEEGRTGQDWLESALSCGLFCCPSGDGSGCGGSGGNIFCGLWY